MRSHLIGLAGTGKDAREQHIPAIHQSGVFKLAGCSNCCVPVETFCPFEFPDTSCSHCPPATGTVEVTTMFDFRRFGETAWDIALATDHGIARLAIADNTLMFDDDEVSPDALIEDYLSLYRHFDQLIGKRRSHEEFARNCK